MLGPHGTSIRRLPGATAQHRQDIAEVTSDLWDYYQELKLINSSLLQGKGAFRPTL
ncbi:hypothetical protein [Microcystis aeruginosa]|uniref:hypothetical protein n=1 Tax=Microcystis aeruginosa TaxID=1126 RepID=UPI0014820027|nr:hypothetical protein [Microcystis aeruginosa]